MRPLIPEEGSSKQLREKSQFAQSNVAQRDLLQKQVQKDNGLIS